METLLASVGFLVFCCLLAGACVYVALAREDGFFRVPLFLPARIVRWIEGGAFFGATPTV